MPEDVKLDLASYGGVDSESLVGLLLGIDSDLNETEPEEQAPLQAPLPNFMPQRSGLDIARIYAAGVTQSPEPTEVTTDAVKRFKVRCDPAGLPR